MRVTIIELDEDGQQTMTTDRQWDSIPRKGERVELTAMAGRVVDVQWMEYGVVVRIQATMPTRADAD